ncbi:MAG: AmmeMemoRadiSam system radical SAM enzyme [Candidatus Njordarchaeum guaymaensis]
MKKAVLYKRLEKEGWVQCTACPRYCVIPKGGIGVCGVRWNIDGDLYLMVYGTILTAHIDPIEKKPLMHFHPGTAVFSIATTGCNWFCKYCQNYDLSQRRKVEGWTTTPEELVKLALEYGADGFAYTYNEPTIFMEFAHDVGVLARKAGLYNVFVTNGYQSLESFKLIKEFLDGATVDFKGNGDPKFLYKYAGVRDPEPIYQSLLEMKKLKIHIEITDLVVPQIGDNLDQARKLVRWIVENLGPETPIHFLRFHPDYLMVNLPVTPTRTIEKHIKIAKEEGAQYVYAGNVPGHPAEHTYCPKCGKLLIRRYGFYILEWNLDDKNRCKFCGYPINIRGSLGPNWNKDRFAAVYLPNSRYIRVKSPSDIKKQH